jgi:diaminohydroxyphosphoribosylaminopyrimidine deaminase/5-amino-6-(5-phosphoribosylamino)uracil reductase
MLRALVVARASSRTAPRPAQRWSASGSVSASKCDGAFSFSEARRHHERVRRVGRLLELEVPPRRAPGDDMEARRATRARAPTPSRAWKAGASGEVTSASGLYDRRVTDTDRAFLERALTLAGESLGVAYPKPTVGAVVARDGEVVGEGVTEAQGRHGEVVALAAAGERARGGTVYVTMEPCNHHGTTPRCTDALLEAGVARVVAGQLDPNPNVEGGGLERLRGAGVEVELADGEPAFRVRQQLEEWRTWVTQGRPFVTYKVAVTLDGRVTVPGERWVTGEASRRLVHLLRAASDAVAVGMGTVRWDDPRLDARDVPTPRGQPRTIAFGRGPLPDGSELELRSGSLRDELETLAADGVQSLLLEGGPTLAAAFLEQDLVDKLLVFVAPKLSGEGSAMVAGLPGKLELTRLEARSIGEDVLLQAYLHEP